MIWPRRCRHSLASRYLKRRCQRNGEKQSCFDDLSVVSLPFCLIKLLISGRTRDPRHRSPLTDFRSAATTAHSRLLQQSGAIEKIVRNHYVLTIFQLFHAPFLKSSCQYHGDRAIRDIATHRPIFTPPPPQPTRVYYNRAAPLKEL
jgi:hypothetical protein